MKKIIAFAFALTIILTSFFGCGFNFNRQNTLKIYNSADYIDMSLVKDFESYYQEKYGEKIKVVYDTFSTNENMYTKIAKGKEDWDIVCTSDYMVQKMKREELLIPLNMSIIKNYLNIPDFIKDSFAIIEETQNYQTGKLPEEVYSVCYMWGTLGIFYNADYVSEEKVKNWSVLWDNEYTGQIYMKDSVRDSVAVAMMHILKDEFLKLEVSGIDDYETRTQRQKLFNNIDDDIIEQISKVLKSQKTELNIKYDVDFDKEEMARGSAYLDVAWSGDVNWAMQEASDGVKLGYSIPQEGSNLWFDAWCIPKYAKNTVAANEFINFVTDIDNAITNMETIGYTSSVSSKEVLEWAQNNWAESCAMYNPDLYSAENLYDVSYFFGEEGSALSVNPIMYPSAADIYRCMIMDDYGTKNTDKILVMWTQVKGGVPSYVYYTVAAILIIIALSVIIYIFKKRKHKISN